HFLGWLVSTFRSREDLVLENLALRRQLLALHAQRPRTRLTALHKLLWVALRTFWSGWRKPLVLVTPRTVVNWHRAGFRLYWTWISRFRRVGGRKRVSKEVRALIFRMVAENPTWGAPRIHGELLKLGFDVSERSVSRWIPQAPRDPDPTKRWMTFLRNHREAIAAMDFFTVPDVTVIPVLVDEARMPLANQLPQDLRKLSDQQARSNSSPRPLADLRVTLRLAICLDCCLFATGGRHSKAIVSCPLKMVFSIRPHSDNLLLRVSFSCKDASYSKYKTRPSGVVAPQNE